MKSEADSVEEDELELLLDEVRALKMLVAWLDVPPFSVTKLVSSDLETEPSPSVSSALTKSLPMLLLELDVDEVELVESSGGGPPGPPGPCGPPWPPPGGGPALAASWSSVMPEELVEDVEVVLVVELDELLDEESRLYRSSAWLVVPPRLEI